MRGLFLLLMLASAGCSADAKGDVRRFQLTGTVVGREASPPRILVAHDAVTGLMPAMTMPFEIGDSTSAMREGDRIVATLAVSGQRSWLENLRVTGRDGALMTPAAGRAMPGALVPALELVDQNGAPLTLRDPARRVRVVTFIYTRCPMPDLCPLMVKHLESIRRRADDEGRGGRLALLAVTLDPVFDSPAVLRSYGESVLKGSKRFDQWTLATGTPAQIEDVARFFGVGFRTQDGFVVHTLSTAVIGHDGRVIRLFPSNSWRPDEVYEVVQRAIERAATP